jgi:hypothetical protein
MRKPRGVNLKTVRGRANYRSIRDSVVGHSTFGGSLPDVAVAHVLTDIRHVCDELTIDYEAADRIAHAYYLAGLSYFRR